MNSDSSHRLSRYALMSQLNGARHGCSSPSNIKRCCTSTSWSDSLENIKTDKLR